MTSKATAKIHLFEGKEGRSTPVFPSRGGYRPHLRPFGSSDMLGVEIVDGPVELIPGQSATVEVAFLYPEVSYSTLDAGARFYILEGAQRVGEGEIVSVSS